MFEKTLGQVCSDRIISSLHSNRPERFNENILRIICLNKAITKFQKELNVLLELKEHLLEKFENIQSSAKLAQFIHQMRNGSQDMGSNLPSTNTFGNKHGDLFDHRAQEFDKNIQQIDMKLSNMMNFMQDFFTSYQ